MTPEQKSRRYMDEKQTAFYTGLSQKTLQRYRVAGKGPAWIKAGARVLYDIADIDIWLESRKVQNTVQARALACN
ncbi:MAG: helix-turn-helix domain-containing protein [Alphaproteobacteria bacterium]|nr:helix-turn-helix domain-containing protein [Alphaproteobacteria bacterium]